jgi:uncharacterized protein (TIGR03083 family)
MVPGESDYLAERAAFLATIEMLPPDEFEHGKTLCEGWAPRDVLAHVMSIDTSALEYAKALGRISVGNQRIVDGLRGLSRADLLTRARQWAPAPSAFARLGSLAFVNDLAVHHQDVLRGLGRTRVVPDYAKRAILREGTMLGARMLLTHRAVPTDVGRPRGRGREVRGPAEPLGMWLAGRDGVSPELTFA